MPSRAGTYDLLLMDLNYTGDTTSGREGIDLLARVQQHDSLLPVVVMTGWGSVDLAVETMRRGVCDFVQKPWDNAQLLDTLRTEIEKGRARRQRRRSKRASSMRRAASSASCCRRRFRRSTAASSRHRGSRQPASAAIASTRSRLAPSRLGLSIADVVGKGIPAALLMSNLQAAVRAFATEATSPGELCQQVNRILCGNIAEGRFISFFYCTVDTALGLLTYANAGHYPPILVRADGSVERLSTGGPVLGVFADASYDQRQIPVASGDRLILFTDGITEVRPAGADRRIRYTSNSARNALIALAIEHRACSAPRFRHG